MTQNNTDDNEAGKFLEQTARKKSTIRTAVTDSSGDLITTNNPLPVHTPPCVCEDNSTSTPLSAGATFTGTSVLTNGYGILYVSVYSDVASATDGLVIEQSTDGTNWDFDDTYTVPADTGKTFSIQPAGRYVRVKYTNGSSDQTQFRLQTVMKATGLDSSHRVQDTLNDDDDGRLRLSVLKLRTAQNNYVSGAATNNGNFKVSLEEFDSGISTNSNSQLNTSPYILDEYGNYNHKLGDNAFKGAILSIPVEHHEIHCGDSYTAHHVEDLGNGATHDYLITTPDWGNPVSGNDPFGNQSIKVAHFVGEISGQSETSVYFYESPTVTDAGNSLNVLNRNRNSSNNDVLSISEGATVSAVGTELEHNQFGAGKTMGGSVNRTDEWVLKNNTTYLIRVVNETTSNNFHSIRFQYYVHGGI